MGVSVGVIDVFNCIEGDLLGFRCFTWVGVSAGVCFARPLGFSFVYVEAGDVFFVEVVCVKRFFRYFARGSCAGGLDAL